MKPTDEQAMQLLMESHSALADLVDVIESDETLTTVVTAIKSAEERFDLLLVDFQRHFLHGATQTRRTFNEVLPRINR